MDAPYSYDRRYIQFLKSREQVRLLLLVYKNGKADAAYLKPARIDRRSFLIVEKLGLISWEYANLGNPKQGGWWVVTPEGARLAESIRNDPALRERLRL